MDQLAQLVIDALGREAVSTDPADLERYSWDALRPSRGFAGLERLAPQPRLVVRPQSAQEVAAAVRLAASQGLAVVAYGGGSGLMGGAIPLHPSLVLDITSMDRVLEISPQDRTVRVQGGALLAQVEQQLSQRGLMLGHDPWSLPIATVGGAIATNSLGYRGAKYGAMGDQVLGLSAVLADGRILPTRAVPKTSTGFDLKQLFIGTEGCFGIITEAVLKAFPQPEKRIQRAYRFPTFEDGFAAVQDMYAVGLVPALMDYGESFAPAPLRRFLPRHFAAAAPTLYLVFEGFREEAEAQDARARALCQARRGRDLGAEEALSFWEQRHVIAQRYAGSRRGRLTERTAASAGLRFDYIHVALPTSSVLGYRRRCQEVARRHRVQALEYGLWCWPELFSVVLAKVSLAGQRAGQALARAVDEMLCLAQDMGGSMEYCHGVGIRLAHLMGREHGDGLEVMRALKRALDPQGILNPGKLGL